MQSLVFEQKRDAVKAFNKATKEPFLVGSSAKPVRVDWARVEVRQRQANGVCGVVNVRQHMRP